MDSKTYIGVELEKLVQRNEIVRIKLGARGNPARRETAEQWFMAFPPRHPVLSTTLDLVTRNILSGCFSELTSFRAIAGSSAAKVAVVHMTGPVVYTRAWDLHPDVATIDTPALFGVYPRESIAYDATKGRYHAEKRGHYSEAKAVVDMEALMELTRVPLGPSGQRSRPDSSDQNMTRCPGTSHGRETRGPG